MLNKFGKRLYNKLATGIRKTSGLTVNNQYNIDALLYECEELLTDKEYSRLKAFLIWANDTNQVIRYVNYEMLYQEFLESRKALITSKFRVIKKEL